MCRIFLYMGMSEKVARICKLYNVTEEEAENDGRYH